MVNKSLKSGALFAIGKGMTRKPVSTLNRIAATGLAVAAACLAYSGFLHMFGHETLAMFVGACAGGFALGRMMRRPARN
jgi:uncharacterized membrane protein YjjB (DUF3815 family)